MDVNEVVSSILKIHRWIQEGDIKKQTGDALSQTAMKLAAFKTTLGGYVADTRLNRDQASTMLDAARAEAYKKRRKLGDSIKDAESTVKAETQAQQVDFNEMSYQYERLRLLHGDCDALLEGMRSRLIHLQTEKGDGRYA